MRLLLFFLSNDLSSKTYCAGDFGAAFIVCSSIHSVKGLSFVVIHKSSEVPVSFGH